MAINQPNKIAVFAFISFPIPAWERLPSSSAKLAEIYDLIHYFRLGLAQENPKSAQKSPKFGFAKGTFKMTADFDEPLEDFKDYMP